MMVAFDKWRRRKPGGAFNYTYPRGVPDRSACALLKRVASCEEDENWHVFIGSHRCTVRPLREFDEMSLSMGRRRYSPKVASSLAAAFSGRCKRVTFFGCTGAALPLQALATAEEPPLVVVLETNKELVQEVSSRLEKGELGRLRLEFRGGCLYGETPLLLAAALRSLRCRVTMCTLNLADMSYPTQIVQRDVDASIQVREAFLALLGALSRQGGASPVYFLMQRDGDKAVLSRIANCFKCMQVEHVLAREGTLARGRGT